MEMGVHVLKVFTTNPPKVSRAPVASQIVLIAYPLQQAATGVG